MKFRVDVLMPGTLENYSVEANEYIRLKVSGQNDEIQAKLLVGSDGNKSKVKEVQKIGTYGWSYNQFGIVCTIQTN